MTAIRILVALVIYEWHKRVKHCEGAEALRGVKGHYLRVRCTSCGLHIWQRDGLFSAKGGR